MAANHSTSVIEKKILIRQIIVSFISRIDEESPLWRMSPQDIQSTNFEIIVTLEGIVEPTGNTTQVGDILNDASLKSV